MKLKYYYRKSREMVNYTKSEMLWNIFILPEGLFHPFLTMKIDSLIKKSFCVIYNM